MKKFTIIKWVRLDKKYILTTISLFVLAFVFFFVLLCVMKFSSPFNSFAEFVYSLVEFFCAFFLYLGSWYFGVPLFFVLIVDRYIPMKKVVESEVHDIEQMPRDEVNDNLKIFIDIFYKDEINDRKKEEMARLTDEEAVNELYFYIRKIQC